MSTVPGTSCLLTDLDDMPTYASRTRTTRQRASVSLGATDPGADVARATVAAMTGRPATCCSVCATPIGDLFTRHSKSGKAFCRTCADRTVAAYLAAHPTARPPRPATRPRERTGTSYLQERDRYAVRFHAGHGRWQISDTQTQRWTRCWHATEAGATAIAATMNAAWRTQIESEKLRFSAQRDLRLAGI